MSEIKRLYRSRTNKMIAGVCAGFADYVNMDPTVIRVLYAIGTLFTAFFGGIILYIVMMIIVPEE